MDERGVSFHNDRKWCPACDAYVPFLLSVSESYCVECGGEVRLFSKEDWESFSETMSARRPGRRKGTRAKPRKDATRSTGRRNSA